MICLSAVHAVTTDIRRCCPITTVSANRYSHGQLDLFPAVFLELTELLLSASLYALGDIQMLIPKQYIHI